MIYFKNSEGDFTLYLQDCVSAMDEIDAGSIDMIFADPPYFLSNGGISFQNGKVVSVNKGEWDRSKGKKQDDEFNSRWLTQCRRVLKDSGTIWVCGSHHNIFSVADKLLELDFKILNVITWVKTNPPPNISCRYFTYSTEFVIWARKHSKIPHYFNYEVMRRMNGNMQMTDVWRIPAISRWEKEFGKHPTQKPLRLLYRILLASSRAGEIILDPFTGSSTTGIAAKLLQRKFIGIDTEQEFLDLSIRRHNAICNEEVSHAYLVRLHENLEDPTVLSVHMRASARTLAMKEGLCYVRAGDSKGSLLVNQGFLRLGYVLLHTSGKDPKLFPLLHRARYQIWSAEELRAKGFQVEHAPCYIVLFFDSVNEVPLITMPQFAANKSICLPALRPLSDYLPIMQV